MHFTKMEGCGNDYVYVNGFEEKISIEEKPELVRKLSDRHFGIGGDGLIFINPTEEADFEMEMYNADGSRSEMCGNGIRCVAKYVYDYGLTDKTKLKIESAGKVKDICLHLKDGKVDQVTVNMAAPELTAELVPVKAGTEQVIDGPINVDGREYRMTCVSMGNPHAVIFMDEIEDLKKDLDIEKIGPLFEHHPCFPNRTNTEFVKVIDRHTVEMRVWERGTGETLACGTGCCATAVACVLNNRTDEDVTVRLLGGELKITWNRTENCVYMTGPARVVFEGNVDI